MHAAIVITSVFESRDRHRNAEPYAPGAREQIGPRCHAGNASVLAHKERHRKNQHRRDEGAEEHAHHRLLVVREHEPQQEQRETELDAFGPQPVRFPMRLRGFGATDCSR